MDFDTALDTLPLVAILRGLQPPEAVDIGMALFDAGFRLIEVPLNSPDPFTSIATLRRALPAEALVGAGTVSRMTELEALKATGAELVVMPHADTALIAAAKASGFTAMPGVATPTEAFAALAAGADALKLFPAEMITPPVVKALRSVLPATVRLFPVGGIGLNNLAAYREAGARGCGLGGSLYKPGSTAAQVAERANALRRAWQGD